MNSARNNIMLVVAGLMIGAGIGLLLLLALGVGGPYIANIFNKQVKGEAPLVPEISSPAPDFELQTLSAGIVRLSDLRGHIVILNFWATWCGPCRLEMPLIEQYYQRYSPNLKVLAINADEPAADVTDFVKELGLTFDVLLDPGQKVGDLYHIRAFPSTFFVDAEGVIRFEHIGTLNEDQLVGYLNKLGAGE